MEFIIRHFDASFQQSSTREMCQSAALERGREWAPVIMSTKKCEKMLGKGKKEKKRRWPPS